MHKYSCISNIRPILIILIRDHLYDNDFKVKEVTQWWNYDMKFQMLQLFENASTINLYQYRYKSTFVLNLHMK